jgi:hypothetical protein
VQSTSVRGRGGWEVLVPHAQLAHGAHHFRGSGVGATQHDTLANDADPQDGYQDRDGCQAVYSDLHGGQKSNRASRG